MNKNTTAIQVPGEIKQFYSILLGFWASYILGNIIYSSQDPNSLKAAISIVDAIFIYFAVMISAEIEFNADILFNNKKFNLAYLMYFIATIYWVVICCILHLSILELKIDTNKVFVLHIWFGALFYMIKLFTLKVLLRR